MGGRNYTFDTISGCASKLFTKDLIKLTYSAFKNANKFSNITLQIVLNSYRQKGYIHEQNKRKHLW